MGKISLIHSKAIEIALEHVSRQYLAGNLQRPQELDFFRDQNIEIGITDYKTYATEPVHYHSTAVEYQYMLSGWTQYMDVDSGSVYEFKKGDFYCIERNTIYAQKSKKGTRILFIKVPSINDKTIVQIDEKVKTWYETGLKTVRKDFSHEALMPAPNSMRPAASVAIVMDGCILMLKRTDNHMWTLPGGTMEFDETLADCATREVREETGLNVTVQDIIGTYTDPDVRIEYSDGEVRREFTVVYYGTASERNIVIDDESSAYSWIPLTEIERIPLADSQRKRIRDVLDYLKTGQKRMG